MPTSKPSVDILGKLVLVFVALIVAAALATIPARFASASAAAAPQAQESQAPEHHDMSNMDMNDDDYALVNYTQYVDYLRRLEGESDRLTVVDIGPTAEGRAEYTLATVKKRNRLAEVSINETIDEAGSF